MVGGVAQTIQQQQKNKERKEERENNRIEAIQQKNASDKKIGTTRS